MIKLSNLSFIGLILLGDPSYAQSISQNWECALDLHQGDKGTLSLNRVDDSLDGAIKFLRNDNVFESNVSGRWSDNKIDLIRLLDADSSELMMGVVVPLGTKKINIGGRYSDNYQGVWSANCDLVSESDNDEITEQQPFTTTKVTPSLPTDKKKVKFNISGAHASGVKQIKIFLGSDLIRTCDSNDCEFSYGPLAKGIYSWRVESVSNDGAQSIESGRLTVQENTAVTRLSASSKKASSCKISGRAIGELAPLAQIYLVKLYGPNNSRALNASSSFDNGVYQFNNLAEGQYQLVVDTKADQEILVSPAVKTMNCKSKSSLTQNFSFN